MNGQIFFSLNDTKAFFTSNAKTGIKYGRVNKNVSFDDITKTNCWHSYGY